MRIATYTRISTDEVNQPYSLGAQSERLASYVASQEDWELTGTFTDQMSGAKLERPGLTNALRAAKAGRFDLLLVYRVDRLSRSVRGLAEVLETLDAAGVGFRSATEPFDTTSAAGRMMVQMLGVFAEFERATIIDRVIAGMERKASQGGWCGGHEPFGYRAVKGEGRLAVDESEAPLIPVIFDLYANKHLGSHAIANQLSAAGLSTRAGRPWQFKSILTVLRNRTYLGQVHFRGTWSKAGHPPLVEKSLFDAAQAILDERGEDVSKWAANSSDYLLTGLVVCGGCGSRFTGTRATGRNATYRYYTCGGRQRYGTKTCSADRLPAEALDDAVVRSLLAAYEDTDLFANAVAEAHGRAQLGHSRHEGELAALDAELAKVDAGIDRYLRAFETGAMPEAICGTRVKALGSQSTALRARREVLSDEMDEADLTAPSPEELSALRDRVAEALASGDPAPVKNLLQALIHEIRVDSRQAIHPIFRVPVGGDHPGDDAVRAPSRSVGAIGRYSNLCEQGECIRDMVRMVPSGPELAEVADRRTQNRLTAEQIDLLVATYVSGATVRTLVDDFQVHRVTVYNLLNRAGVARRPQGLSSEEFESAKRLYETGLSLAGVSETIGCNAETLRRAFNHAGVTVRTRRGWH